MEAYGLKPKSEEIDKMKPRQCPNCNELNKIDSKFCVKCRMVLSYDSYMETVSESQVHNQFLDTLEKKLDDMYSKMQEMEKVTNQLSGNKI